MKLKIMTSNVRGANDPDRRKIIKNFIRYQRVDLVCLQETKIQEMNAIVARSLEVGRLTDWRALNAEGFAGGILLFWDKRRMELVDSEIGLFSISCLFKMVEGGFQWTFSGEFMVQLRGGLRKLFGRSWVASGVGGKVLGVWVGISMRFSPP